MSFTDRLVLWLHIGFAIFTIGPVTVAISSTPRYVRNRNLTVVQYLYRMTRVFTILSLAVLIAGLILAQLDKDFSKPWLAAAGTLFVVAIVLLVLIMRDQHRAIGALQAAGPGGSPPADTVAATAVPGNGPGASTGAAGAAVPGAAVPGAGGTEPAEPPPGSPLGQAAAAGHVAAVERGRIASMGGVVAVIWLVILVLMVWNS